MATVEASAMASLDATVVNVALPHIGEEFDATISSLQWVLTGYLVALASLILLGGALGDRFGRRKIFVIGTVWFAAASLLCGAAPNVDVLVAARVLQGVGGGAWSGLGGVAGDDRTIRGRRARRRSRVAMGVPHQCASGWDRHHVRSQGTWDPRSGRRQRVFLGHDRPVHDIAISPDGGSLVSAGADGTIRFWPVEG